MTSNLLQDLFLSGGSSRFYFRGTLRVLILRGEKNQTVQGTTLRRRFVLALCVNGEARSCCSLCARTAAGIQSRGSRGDDGQEAFSTRLA